MDEAPAPRDERLQFIYTVLIGYRVEVTLKSGMVYEGIFHASNYGLDKGEELGYSLKFARVTKDPTLTADKDAIAEKPSKSKRFKASEILFVQAKDIRMSKEDLASPDDFDTDSAISRGRAGGFGRELQRWVPDAEDAGPLLSLDDQGTTWDQFAVNENKFGVTTTYDEAIYTTTLDKQQCKISEKEAARLAREIEQGNHLPTATGLAAYHILEERGFEIDDDTMNEEDKYGAVVRDVSQHDRNGAGYHGQQQQGRAYPHPGYTGGSSGGGARPHPGAPPPPPPPRAWGGAGAGVAVLAGKQGGPAGPVAVPGAAVPPAGQAAAAAAAPATGASASSWAAAAAGAAAGTKAAAAAAAGGGAAPPIAPTSQVEDQLRKETNKVRHQLASCALPVRKSNETAGVHRSAILGPGNRSPLSSSPLVGDGHKLMALNLELPGPGSNTPQQRAEFGKWVAKEKLRKEQEESQKRLEDLKAIASFSAAGPGGSRPAGKSGAGSSTIGSPQTSVTAPAAATAVKPGAETQPAATSGAAAPNGSAAAADGQASAGDAANKAAAGAGDAAGTSAAGALPPKKSTLNPFAKAFTLSVAAKPFVPGGASAGSSGGSAALTSSASVATAGAGGVGGGSQAGSVGGHPAAIPSHVSAPVSNTSHHHHAAANHAGNRNHMGGPHGQSHGPGGYSGPHAITGVHVPMGGHGGMHPHAPHGVMAVQHPDHLQHAHSHTGGHPMAHPHPHAAHMPGAGSIPPGGDGVMNAVHPGAMGNMRGIPAGSMPIAIAPAAGGRPAASSPGHMDPPAGPHGIPVGMPNPGAMPVAAPGAAPMQYMAIATAAAPYGQGMQVAPGGSQAMPMSPAGVMAPGMMGPHGGVMYAPGAPPPPGHGHAPMGMPVRPGMGPGGAQQVFVPVPMPSNGGVMHTGQGMFMTGVPGGPEGYMPMAVAGSAPYAMQVPPPMGMPMPQAPNMSGGGMGGHHMASPQGADMHMHGSLVSHGSGNMKGMMGGPGGGRGGRGGGRGGHGHGHGPHGGMDGMGHSMQVVQVAHDGGMKPPPPPPPPLVRHSSGTHKGSEGN